VSDKKNKQTETESRDSGTERKWAIICDANFLHVTPGNSNLDANSNFPAILLRFPSCMCVCVGVRVGGRSRSSTGRSTVGESGLCSRFLCESSTYSYMLQFQLANVRMCACVTR